MGNQAMTRMEDEVPMTGMDDVERQARHGDTEILEKKTKAARDSCFLCVAVILSVVSTLGLVIPLLIFAPLNTHYYVAIDSVSDLDPTTGLSFNLTVGLSSWNLVDKSCIEPGTYAQVSYRGVPLAASEAQVGRLCGRRGKSVEHHVSARVTGVPAAGGLMDNLEAHMRQGTPEFDVTLHLPAGSYGVDGGENWVSECKGSGVAAAAVWCDNPKRGPTW